jgi:hypothetical protein
MTAWTSRPQRMPSKLLASSMRSLHTSSLPTCRCRAWTGSRFWKGCGRATNRLRSLRFLQEHAFERVGGTQTLKVNVRVIAATNRDLRAEVAAGRFREGLFYRLNVVALEMPPLRNRRTDIPALAKFVDRYAAANGKHIDEIAPDAVAVLTSYGWPGNVRELENAVERAVVLCAGSIVEAKHLPLQVRPQVAPTGTPTIPGATMADVERYAILETLKATGWSTSKAGGPRHQHADHPVPTARLRCRTAAADRIGTTGRGQPAQVASCQVAPQVRAMSPLVPSASHRSRRASEHVLRPIDFSASFRRAAELATSMVRRRDRGSPSPHWSLGERAADRARGNGRDAYRSR